MANTRPTRKPVAPVEEVSDACREQLLTGHDFFGDGYGHDAENDPTAMERMREDWETHREEMLAKWIAERPGSRPWAWWTFDAPTRRETSDGSVHPFDRPTRRELCEKWHAQYPAMRYDLRFWDLYYGRPAIIVGEGMVHYESQRAYLARHNSLTSDEFCRCTSTKENQ